MSLLHPQNMEEAKSIVKNYRVDATLEKIAISLTGISFLGSITSFAVVGISHLLGSDEVAGYAATIGCFSGIACCFGTLGLMVYGMNRNNLSSGDLNMDYYDNARQYIKERKELSDKLN